MYARVTTYQADPARLEELRTKLPDIKEKLEEMDGLEDWYTVWRADGQGVVFTVYKDKEAADASLNEVRSIWAILSRLLYGVPKVENFDNVETLEDWGVSPHTTREILAGGSSGLDPRFIGRW